MYASQLPSQVTSFPCPVNQSGEYLLVAPRQCAQTAQVRSAATQPLPLSPLSAPLTHLSYYNPHPGFLVLPYHAQKGLLPWEAGLQQPAIADSVRLERPELLRLRLGISSTSQRI